MAESKFTNPLPRSDCKHLSKCGKHSIHYCRTNRNHNNDCLHCSLIRKHHRHNTKIENDIELRKCPTCNRFLPLHRFYSKTNHYKDRIYHTYSSSCKMCTSAKEAEKIRNRKKKEVL